jgi:hypothetical protein
LFQDARAGGAPGAERGDLSGLTRDGDVGVQ